MPKTVDEAAGNEPTIAVLIDRYVPSYKEGSSGANRTRACHLKGDVRRYFGAMKPAEIHQGHLDAFRDQLRKRKGRRKGTKIADQTIRNKSYALLALLGWAAARKLIGRRDDLTVNVAPTKAVRAVDDPEVLPLSDEEVAKLLKACSDPRIIAAIRLATDAGLRIGEIIGAQWTDIKNGAITIRRQVDDRNVEGPPKGKLAHGAVVERNDQGAVQSPEARDLDPDAERR